MLTFECIALEIICQCCDDPSLVETLVDPGVEVLLSRFLEAFAIYFLIKIVSIPFPSVKNSVTAVQERHTNTGS